MPLHVVELAADVDVGDLRADRAAADDAAFDQQVRVALHQHVILERARLALVGVAADVLRLRRCPSARSCHFMPVGKPAPPRPRRPGRLQLVDDRRPASSTAPCACPGSRRAAGRSPACSSRLVDVLGEDGSIDWANDVCSSTSKDRVRLAVPTRARPPAQMAAGERRRGRACAGPRGTAARPPGAGARASVVVHHHDRRAIAGAETLELQQRERADGIGLARLDPSCSQSASVTRSAPFSAHDSVRHTCSTYLPTGRVKNIT